MTLKKLRKAFGPGYQVTRQRRQRKTQVQAGGLSYTAAEERFESEKQLAEFVKSKVPAVTVLPGNDQ